VGGTRVIGSLKSRLVHWRQKAPPGKPHFKLLHVPGSLGKRMVQIPWDLWVRAFATLESGATVTAEGGKKHPGGEGGIP